MGNDELLEWFDFGNFQDTLDSETEMRREQGLSLYVAMIKEVLRCICDLEGGVVVDIEEIRDFLSRPHAYLCCMNGACEITIKRVPGQKGFKLHSVRFLDIYSSHRSYSVH